MENYESLFRELADEVIKEMGLELNKSGKREIVKIIKKGFEERGYTP